MTIPMGPRRSTADSPGENTRAAPLNGTNVGWEETEALDAEPVPPPVKFAPLGPIGLESSTNEQFEAVQIHCPLMGSQNGVEQFAEMW